VKPWAKHPASEVPEGHYTVPIGKAAVVREGSELTVLAYGTMVHVALAAVEDNGLDAEVIDLRTLVPLDVSTLLASVSKTSRLFTVEENPRLCGWGAEVVSIVAEEAIYALDGPVVRITTPHVPLAANPVLEDAQMPSAERIAAAIRPPLEAPRGWQRSRS
jgi:pyruvate/2-oxoglutarate/acetoin dehydrogenase E1 component